MKLFLTTLPTESQVVFLKSSLIILYLILAALALSCLLFTLIMLRSPLEGGSPKFLMVLLYLVTAFVLISAIICSDQYNKLVSPPDVQSLSPSTSTEDTDGNPQNASTAPDESLIFSGSAHYADSTNPANWNIKWEVMQYSNVLSNYRHPDSIVFSTPETYTALEGITTFRGNNYRDNASYGSANIIDQTILESWNSEVGSLNGEASCRRTGQPLIVRWSKETKAIMNLKEDKKAKTDLKEVIYATMDGNIYFYDLDDGTYTRDPIQIGMNFACSGTLDPRGYPLLYLGACDGENKAPRIYVISLIDGKILYEQTGSDIDAYYRRFSFNAAPLLSADSDTLVWPCESGIVYLIKLNSAYTPANGTVSVKPENMIKLRYTGTIETSGITASPVMAENYLYLADNNGMIFCVDTATMQLIWAQETKDCLSATPLLQKVEDATYLYIATTSVSDRSNCDIYKLNAHTGEIIWQYTATHIHSGSTIPGGSLASPILGKPGSSMDGMIIFNIARCPSPELGTIIALDAQTGAPVWEQELPGYSWSSPVVLYTSDEVGYFVSCDSLGTVSLHEGATGNLLSSVNVGSGIEASPVAFENTIVVGTNTDRVYAFTVQ